MVGGIVAGRNRAVGLTTFGMEQAVERGVTITGMTLAMIQTLYISRALLWRA